MSRSFWRRKRFLVQPERQLKLAVTLMISFVVYSGVLAFIIFYPFAREFHSAANFEEQAQISTLVLHLHARLWPAVALIAFLVGAQVILVSHRFYGPVYRFEQAIKDFLRGDYSKRIKIRKHDNFKELEVLINRLGEKLEADAGSESSARLAERLRKTLGELEADGPGRTETRSILAGLIRELEESAGRTPGNVRHLSEAAANKEAKGTRKTAIHE